MKKRCLGGRAETLGLLGYILVHKKDFGRGDEGIRNWICGNAKGIFRSVFRRAKGSTVELEERKQEEDAQGSE